MTGIELISAAGFTAAGLFVGASINTATRRLQGGQSGMSPGGQDDRLPIGRDTVLASLAGGLIALAAVARQAGSPLEMTFTALFGWLLLALSIVDFRTFILPDRLNLAVLLLGAVVVTLYAPERWPWHLAGAAAGYGILWIVEVGYRTIRRQDGLGRGDAKLLGAIGMWVGVLGIPQVLMIASLSGILAALVSSWRRKEPLSGHSSIAFGPWIALGGYCVWLFPALLIPVL